jgi:hypothetical protein
VCTRYSVVKERCVSGRRYAARSSSSVAITLRAPRPSRCSGGIVLLLPKRPNRARAVRGHRASLHPATGIHRCDRPPGPATRPVGRSTPRCVAVPRDRAARPRLTPVAYAGRAAGVNPPEVTSSNDGLRRALLVYARLVTARVAGAPPIVLVKFVDKTSRSPRAPYNYPSKSCRTTDPNTAESSIGAARRLEDICRRQ